MAGRKKPSPLITTLRSLAANVRVLREARGLTQEAAAEAAGLSYVYWKQLEHARATNPSIETIVAVASALDVDPGELLRLRDALPARPPGRPRTARVKQ